MPVSRGRSSGQSGLNQPRTESGDVHSGPPRPSADGTSFGSQTGVFRNMIPKFWGR